MRLKDPVAVVTGTSRGLGKRIARKLNRYSVRAARAYKRIVGGARRDCAGAER